MAECKRIKWTSLILTIADHIILAFIIAPLTVMFWWATWSLIDYYLYPDNKLARGGITFLIGLNGMTLCYCAQDPFTYFTRKYKNIFVWIIFNHIYSAFFGLCNVCHWHGVWSLCDLLIDLLIGYWGDQLTWTIIFLSATIVSLCLMRQLVNVRGPPVAIAIDIDSKIYKISTRFNRSWQKHGASFIFDCAFTSCIVHSFVVLFWRNSWVIWDLKMAHFELATDGAICLIAAYIMLSLVYAMQILVAKMVRNVSKTKEHWILNILIEQLMLHLWAGEAAVAIWRGCWLLYSSYIQIPNYPAGGFWVGCISGMGALMFMMAAMSVLARGGDIDGAKEDGSGAILITKYLRYFYEKRLVKKERKDVMLEMKELSEKQENGKLQGCEDGDKLLKKVANVI